MPNKELLIIADYSTESTLSLEEICRICDIQTMVLHELVMHDIVKPAGEKQGQWVFDLTQLRRLQMALRLQRDLEVNIMGVALVLDLLEELDDHRARLALLEKHYLR